MTDVDSSRDGTLEENETNRQEIDNMMKMMTDAYEKMQLLRGI